MDFHFFERNSYICNIDTDTKQTEMTQKDKELRQRLAVLFKQLEMYNQYPEEFLKPLGKSGVQAWLDEVLDEINEINNQLNNLN